MPPPPSPRRIVSPGDSDAEPCALANGKTNDCMMERMAPCIVFFYGFPYWVGRLISRHLISVDDYERSLANSPSAIQTHSPPLFSRGVVVLPLSIETHNRFPSFFFPPNGLRCDEWLRWQPHQSNRMRRRPRAQCRIHA